MMIGHYLVSALARFRKAPFTTAANVLTLALGLACFIAAYGIASYWRSGDSHHPGADRIFYIAQASFGGDDFGITSSAPLPGALKSDIPELEAVTQIQGRAHSSMMEAPYSAGEREAFLTSAAADAGLFDVFAFEFVEGDRQTALRAPNDVVITEDAARRLFGDAPALGQAISYLGLIDFTVSGVIAPVQQPSFMGHTSESPISFDVLQNMSLRMPDTESATWNRLGGTTVVRLPPSLSVEAFQTRLDSMAERVSSADAGFEVRLAAEPISDLTSQLINGRLLSQADGLAGVSASAILLGLGALILIVACVNYANLAAAQAEARLKETGMRKVLGAGRRALLAQHMVQSGLLTIPALGLAILVTALAAPVLENVLGVEVTHFLTAGPGGALFLIAVSVISAAAAAAYPALVTARARAANALGAGPTRTGSGVTARILVGVQFLSASFLIIVVTATQLQQAHLRAQFTDVDLQGDTVLYLDWIPGVEDLDEIASDGPRASDFEVFAAELLSSPQIRSVTAIDAVPLIDTSGSFGAYAAVAEPGAAVHTVQERGVGRDYVETLGVRVLAGRALDPARDRSGAGVATTELAPVMIDRRLAGALGYRTPEAAVGQTLYGPAGGTAEEPGTRTPVARVVGVVESDTSRLIAEMGVFNRIAGVAYSLDLDYRDAQYPAIRIDSDDVPGALAALQRVWSELQPNLPLRVRFADDLLTEAYAPFRRIAGAFIVLSAAALVISTTGLLGVAVHVAARRRREMGVRKTLGATALRLARLLLADFSKPVLVANLLAWPLGYLAVQAYLQPFTERIALTPTPFLASMALTLAIAWAAVMGEVLKAASVRPAEVLRQA